MSLENFVISGKKKGATKDYEGHIKSNEEISCRGSHWAKDENLIVNKDKNYTVPKHTKYIKYINSLRHF